MRKLFVPAGPPGAVAGSLRVQRKPSRTGGSHALYSERSWQRLTGGLARTQPFHVELTMSPLGDDGRPLPFGVTVAVHRNHEHPEWVSFEIEALPGNPAWPLAPAYEPTTWTGFIKSRAGQFGACYGHITDDADTRYGTALERATQQEPANTIPRCREILRGYSWVTICAHELANRLGGPAALADSGAFHEVSQLPRGQVFLRATATLDQYRGNAVRRVFQTLAPVLLTGRPAEPYPGYLRLVADADAADYQ